MKKNASFSIEEQLQVDFKDACDFTAVNRSAWLSLKMQEYIDYVNELKKSAQTAKEVKR